MVPETGVSFTKGTKIPENEYLQGTKKSSFQDIQGATSKFAYVPESRKNRVPNWPPQKMAESRTCHPQKMAESPTLVSLGVASPGLCHFLAVASLGLCFFSGFMENLGVARRIRHPVPLKQGMVYLKAEMRSFLPLTGTRVCRTL